MAENVVQKGLQQGLVDLIQLSLQAKQAHWNIRGEGFQSLHEFLDTVVDQARLALDEFAERLSALGFEADGRAETVNATTTLKELPGGFIPVDEGYRLMEAAVMQTAATMKEYLEAVDDADPLSGDLLISTARELEKSGWMLRMYTK